MSDNIPLEIQMDIIQRIPDIKSVIQYRTVSKTWKSVIDSKEFIKNHTLRHQENHHLLIRAHDCSDKQVKYVSIVDDDTFPHRKLSVFVPDSVNKLCRVVGTSHGLFCLYQANFKKSYSTAVIWNPSTRKTVAIKVPNVSRRYYRTFVGFGICPRNLDPKLVKITYVFDWSKLHDVNTSTQVEVFTLSSGGIWRSPLSSSVPHKSFGFGSSQAVVDGFIYWNAFDNMNEDDGSRNPNLIMSFDLTTEEFTKINLPNRLALDPDAAFSVCNLRESLAVLDFSIYTKREICDVWMMIGHGCTRSFNRLYSIHAPDASICTILGFRKSGAPIIELENDKEDYRYKPDALAIYEPESKNITNIGIHGLEGSFFVRSYNETLLLLGH